LTRLTLWWIRSCSGIGGQGSTASEIKSKKNPTEGIKVNLELAVPEEEVSGAMTPTPGPSSVGRPTEEKTTLKRESQISLLTPTRGLLAIPLFLFLLTVIGAALEILRMTETVSPSEFHGHLQLLQTVQNGECLLQ
jgi:hypothetical protein